MSPYTQPLGRYWRASGQVGRGDGLGAGQLEDAVEGASGEVGWLVAAFSRPWAVASRAQYWRTRVGVISLLPLR